MAKSESNDARNADTGAKAAAPKNKSGTKRRAGGANWSPRNCLLVRDFLVPRLDRCLYGEDLKWIDRNEGIFLIRWTHQGSKSFNREGPNVFRDWSILKRKWDDSDPNRLSKAKQRVRDARWRFGTRIFLSSAEKDNKETRPQMDSVWTCRRRLCFFPPSSVRCDISAYRKCRCMSDSDSESVPPPTCASDVWSTMRSLTESSFVTLATLKNGSRQHNCHTSVTPPPPLQPAQPTSDLLAPTAQATVGTSAPPSTARQEDQVVPIQTGVSSPQPSVDEGSLSPHSVHSFKEQVATAMATAPRSTQAETATGGSPPMFLAEAAPAHQGEQLVSGALQDSGAMSAFCSQQTPKAEPSTEHTDGRPATAAMTGAAAVQSGWSGHATSSSWLARDEPVYGYPFGSIVHCKGRPSTCFDCL
ncbi:hypothetical protein HPB50_003438 [Hyalomma asiaticum]|uniref:Uncharacterized protein n=1 Tax=Hyalomma asiaticum TaxID=266040 RepID=A0ACB7RHK0_HYAAI|nr:hypothetical protein HPB50_003438 [Hyalomma asiaticum]